MRPRVLAIIIPIALVLVACAGSAAAPTWTYAPSASARAIASPTATVAPTVAPTIAPSVAPSAEPLTGEVEVVMTDAMRFVPEPLAVKAGEEVTFVVRNEGVIVHEFFVGTEEEQVEHAAEMAEGGMSHGHDNALSLGAGESGSLTMVFAEAASLLIGCHEPGHYDAGMKATLTVID
jgi:uncharacterized cupredoxin-like copper-binding protein